MPALRYILLCLGLILAQPVLIHSALAQSFQERVNADAASYNKSKISLVGYVVDERGRAIPNVLVRLYGWGDSAANNRVQTLSVRNGRFAFSAVRRRAALMKISRAGYYNEIIPVDLQQDSSRSRLYVGKIKLYKKRAGRARLIFGGDVMLGRRFFDHDGDDVIDVGNELLNDATLTTDSKRVFKYIRQALKSDDHTSVNLESPVTDNPVTMHPTKSYSFYTKPESLEVFKTVGIDSVSLGNNHVYDYLESGLVDTFNEIDRAGLNAYGAGMNDSEAMASRMRMRINDIRFSLQGFSELTGDSYGSEALQIVAKDTPIVKGGALELSEARLQGFVDQESASRFTIPVFHGGKEYAYQQTPAMRAYFKLAVEHGADMVVAHHPHVAQGIGIYDVGTGPKWIFGSLGNFVFDQNVFESFRGYLTMVDIQQSSSGHKVKRVRLLPYRIDDYSPRFLVGAGLTNMVRHIAHLSTMDNELNDGISAAAVFEVKGRVFAYADPERYNTKSITEIDSVNVISGESTLFEFLPVKPSDTLTRVTTSRPATCDVGRDIYVLGDFEEQDVDDRYNEGDLWSQTENRFVQSSEAHRGRNAMAIVRHSDDEVRASTWIVNKISVEPGQSLTLTGFHKRDNAGTLMISVRWLTGSDTHSYETDLEIAPGSNDWQRIVTNLTVPSGSDGVKIYYRHYPPAQGEGVVWLDDLNLVAWDDTELVTGNGAELHGPNDWRFVRCRSAEDGPMGLTLRRTTYSLR